MSYTLISGVERNREHPDTFQIPSQSDREGVQPGDFVKLMFDDGDFAERMWVRVTKLGRVLKGTLANNPFAMDMDFGDEVVFQAEHIIDITAA